MGTVNFQINSPQELPQIYHDSKMNKDMNSITLEKGHEYFIEITPTGQMVTKSFSEMSYEQRKCLLSNEVPSASKV